MACNCSGWANLLPIISAIQRCIHFTLREVRDRHTHNQPTRCQPARHNAREDAENGGTVNGSRLVSGVCHSMPSFYYITYTRLHRQCVWCGVNASGFNAKPTTRLYILYALSRLPTIVSINYIPQLFGCTIISANALGGACAQDSS